MKKIEFKNFQLKNFSLNKKNVLSFIGLFLILTSVFIAGVNVINKKYYAFDGAEGFGAYTEGGRHGLVYHVTTLEDINKEGSLRYALEQPNDRVIIFDISGIINLKEPIIINNGNLTVAGQTAPGDGICIKGNGIIIKDAKNIILRYIRIRPGKNNKETPALSLTNVKNIIIDHCSISWATGGNIILNHVDNATIQWNFINETLGKFAISFSGKNRNISIHHNLFANNHETNINFNPEYENKSIDIRNNVFFNWDINTITNPGRGDFNIVKNYFKYSSNTEKNNKNQIVSTLYSPKVKNIIFAKDNEIYLNPIISKNNIAGIYPNIEFLQKAKNKYVTNTEFYHAAISTHSGARTFQKVLDFGGASLRRDYSDLKVLKDMTNSSFSNKDLYVNFGIYPAYQTELTFADLDNDGIRDDWELKNKLNPFNPLDAFDKNKRRKNCTNREVYLDSFVKDINKKGLQNTILCLDTLKIKINKTISMFKR